MENQGEPTPVQVQEMSSLPGLQPQTTGRFIGDAYGVDIPEMNNSSNPPRGKV